MKLLLAQEYSVRFLWELEVLITNFRSLSDMPILVLFMEKDPPAPGILTEHENVEIYHYPDERVLKTYQATTRPYLIWRHLTAYPEFERDDYFQVDSDIIFRQLPDFSKMDLSTKTMFASDCSGYVSGNYLSQVEHGDYIIQEMAEICGVSEENIRSTPGGGAQFVYRNPTAALWKDIYHSSQDLWDMINPIPSNIQKWSVEMEAQLHSFVKHGYRVELSDELSFCRPTDPVEEYGRVNILHNAGVVGTPDLFFKGAWNKTPPFGQDFSWVNPDFASIKYVEAIEKCHNNE